MDRNTVYPKTARNCVVRVVKACAFLLILLSALPVVAQNLVRNGSFEDKVYCPSNFNQTQLNLVKEWIQPTGATPDYFNACSKKAGVPRNMFGEQEAREGDGYLGIVTYTPSQRNYREYVQTKLSRPLKSGELVCVEYHISPGDGARYVTDGFGAHFSNTRVKDSRQKRLPVTASVDNPRLHIIDKFEVWTKVSDVYTARGGEQYLTFGNFKPDRETNVLRREDPEVSIESEWSYIYLDEVVVKPVEHREDCSCVNDIIRENVHEPPLQLEEVRELRFGAIQFDFDRAALTDSARAELDDIVKTLDRGTTAFLRVTGHTDVIGSNAYNLGLSQRRADNVLGYLEDKGVDPVRLELEWKGSNDPVADNQTSEGRARNRRVEFEVLVRRYSDATPR